MFHFLTRANTLDFFFFFLMFQRQPRSTLFPYTTLFRSIVRDQRSLPESLFPVSAPLTTWRQVVNGDRKSTRLNSSHRCISYAVFCLKKKNNTLSHTL